MTFFRTDGGAGAHDGSRRRQRGASMLEGMIALCFMCFIFFALLQVYQWCAARIFTRYSAYYGAKGRALGYKTNIMLRAARVAAIPVSGPSAGRTMRRELDGAVLYMRTGDASGVWYRYWYPQTGEEPELRLRGYHEGDNIHVTVKLANAPLISPVLGKVLGIAENPEPAGSSRFYDHGAAYLEE